MSSLKGKKILIGISGGIAAYKCITLVRSLTKNGAEVKVVMTPAAKDFVSPLVLSTLSRNKVLMALAEGDSWADHVALGRWADLMVITPLTCNTLAKMATGICDNLLMAVYLSATCPVVVAPAMDEDMWHHPTTVMNLQRLRSFGNEVIDAVHGELASGLIGKGRMAEPEDILAFIQQRYFEPGPLYGKKAIVTAGPTFEPIDPVRFIGNHSTGKMGIAIANALSDLGAEVTLVLGPTHLSANSRVHTIRVTTAQEMFDATMGSFDSMDMAVMAAAVADYRPAHVSDQKIKKHDDELQLSLIKNPDILKACGERKRPGQLVIGFALETNDESANAMKKLQQKHADMIILNSMNDQGAGFRSDTNKITIFEKDGNIEHWDLMGKEELGNRLASHFCKRMTR